MKKYKTKSLVALKNCPSQAFLQGMNLGFRGNGKTSMNFALKCIVQEKGFHVFDDLAKLEVELIERTKDDYFGSIFDKEKAIEDLMADIVTMKSAIMLDDLQPVEDLYGKTYHVELAGADFSVQVDFFMKDSNGNIYPTVFQTKKEQWTAKPGSKNYYGDDPRFLLIKLAGQKEFPGGKIVPAILNLRTSSKAKKMVTAIEKFFFAPAVISEPFLENNIKDLVSQEMSMSNHTADETKCVTCTFKNICKMKDNSQMVLEEKKEDFSKSSGKKSVTPSQQAVIDHSEGVMRVLAVAGAGKTFCLTQNVIKQLKAGANPKDFLIVTFTKKGAKEIQDRIYAEMDKLGIKGTIKVETFNSFGEKVLLANYQKAGYEYMQPNMIDDVDAYDILVELANSGIRVSGINYSISDTSNPFKQRGSLSTLYTNIGIYKEEMASDPNKKDVDSLAWKNLKDVLDNDGFNQFKVLVEEYNQRIHEEYFYDYADQVIMAKKLLEDPEILAKNDYKKIIIDEFQDTSKSQLDIVKLLYKEGKGRYLIVVGDDQQSIFGFRGVGPKNIIDFPKEFNGCVDIKMEDNFRCCSSIIDLANKVISLNKERAGDVKLISHREEGEVIIQNKDGYIDTVVKDVLDEIKRGTDISDIAVLTATRFEMFGVRDLLRENGVPVAMSTSERYLDDINVFGAYGLSAFLADKTYKQGLLQFMIAKDISYREKIKEEDIDTLAEELYKEFEDLNQEEKCSFFLNKLEELPMTTAGEELKVYFKDNFKKFDEIKVYLNKLVSYGSDKSVEEDEKNYVAVTLSTIHSAKGKEWKTVIIVDNKIKEVIAGDSDKDSSLKDPKKVVNPIFDEERMRLLYVAITRAKDRLYFIQPDIGQDSLNVLAKNLTVNQFAKAFGPRVPIPSKAQKGDN